MLVRHAPTIPEAGVNSAQWALTADARQRTEALARQLIGAYDVDLVVTSREPKAVGTGRTLAAGLGVRSVIGADLEEHHRRRTALMPEAEWFRTIKRFFDNPHVLLIGQETADEARLRIERGVNAALRENPGKRLALVSHANVLSLLLAKPNGVPPYELWRTFKMPEAVVVHPETFEIIERVAPEMGA